MRASTTSVFSLVVNLLMRVMRELALLVATEACDQTARVSLSLLLSLVDLSEDLTSVTWVEGLSFLRSG